MATAMKTTEAPKIREIKGTTASLFALHLGIYDPTAVRLPDKGLRLIVDDSTAIKLLNKAGLRLLEDTEILSVLAEDEELREKLKGTRFRVTGQSKKDKLYAIHDQKLTNGKGASLEKTVLCCLNSEKPHSLDVFLDYDCNNTFFGTYLDYRYRLIGPTEATRSSWYMGEQLILGVPKDQDFQVTKLFGRIDTIFTELRKENTQLKAEMLKLKKQLR